MNRRSLILDTFMINDELDMLETRLCELEAVPNLIHIAVEADVDHQDHPKPYHLSDNLDRFAPWKERLLVVRATGLPAAAEDPDPWAREHAQREHLFSAFSYLDVAPTDVVLHGDIDEIPTALVARNIRPEGFVAFEQTMYCFAVDWRHPDRWCGTVAGRVGSISSFGAMRDARNYAKTLPNAGWHLSWLGGRDATLRKLGSFCHPEIAERTHAGIEADLFLSHGFHVDGKKLAPVEVDSTWPRYVYERRCPPAWFRPRHVVDTGWQAPAGFA